jgi:acetyl-CoA carboxylase carboxyltransferase component
MSAAANSVLSPLTGTVLSCVSVGETVAAGRPLVVIESMKMEHVVEAPGSVEVKRVWVAPGDTVGEGQLLVEVAPAQTPGGVRDVAPTASSGERVDVARLRERRGYLKDSARPEAVAKRREKGRRTARENIADLLDDGSFQEYGGFGVAAQRQRRSEDDLIANTPADGLICGTGTVNADDTEEGRASVLAMSYDYTVLAGTQGYVNHKKTDRVLEVARRNMLPVVLFAEGGGGRPGDTDAPVVAGLDVMSFASFASLSGLVPLVGIASGYCFAGNAALLGCCDVVIATEDSNIGMAGPAMIEGGGLGVVAPTAIGPIEVQTKNGVVDVRVADDVEAVDMAKRYLSYFQGRRSSWQEPDVATLADVVPVERVRVYDVRRAIDGIADRDSVLELRRDFGVGILTSLARIAGRPVGIVANNPVHLGGAIDSDAANKMARFVQLCDAFDLPVVSLCDTPGFMVGPDAEHSAQVRHFARLFVTASSVTVPWMTVVLRKGYGLGAQAMAGGSFHAKDLIVSWPTGEFGGMGLEGAVRLGFRKELEAAATPAEREELEAKLIAAAYERGGALSMASHVEIDDVIEPTETRARLIAALDACPVVAPRATKKRPMVDTW